MGRRERRKFTPEFKREAVKAVEQGRSLTAVARELDIRQVWPTRTMCQMLDVSTSGFYEWHGRPPSALRWRTRSRCCAFARATR